MAKQYRDMWVGEFIGWAKQIDLPYRLEQVLADAKSPPQLKSLARIGLAFCNETKIQTFRADKVLNLAETATTAGLITAAERDDLLELNSFDPDEERLKELADHLVGRDEEVAAYQLNIDNYTAMVAALDAALPAEWPQELLAFRGKAPDFVYANAPADKVEMLIDLGYRDRLRFLLRSERGEQRKTELVGEQIRGRLPAERLAELKAAALARRQMRKEG